MGGRYLNSPYVEAECKAIDAALIALEDELDGHTCDGEDCGQPLSHGGTVGLSYAAAKVLLAKLDRLKLLHGQIRLLANANRHSDHVAARSLRVLRDQIDKT